MATGTTYLLRRKDSEPSKAAQDARLLLLVLESGLGADGRDEILFVGRRGRDDLLRSLLPRDGLLAEALLHVIEEANVNENLDELWEAAISQSTPRYMLGICVASKDPRERT